jgi:hypothetical protein
MVLLSGLYIYSFQFGSTLNPDSSIRMNCRYGPWIFSPDGLCFAEYRLGVAHFSMLQALETRIFSYSLFVF